LGTKRKLGDIALILRSKNAGPFMLTLDIVLPSPECMHEVAEKLCREEIARLYAVEPSEVEVIEYPPANAVKVNVKRRIAAGEPGDTDVYGAQQHLPLASIELEVEKC